MTTPTLPRLLGVPAPPPVLALTAAALFAPFPVPGQATAPPAAVRIENPREPPAHWTAELGEIWRLDGEDESCPLLGQPITAAIDPDGTVFLLDRQLCHVLVISPAGEPLGTLSRDGEGPGEVRLPTGVTLLDGGVVGILQGYPGRIVCVERDGTPASVVHVGGDPAGGNVVMLSSATYRDGFLLVQASTMVFDAGSMKETAFLALCGRDGGERTRFCEHTTTREVERFEFDEAEGWSTATAPHALGPGGEVYLVPERDRYLIQVRDALGELVREIARDQPPRRRTPEEIEEHKRTGYAFSQGIDMERVSITACSHDPAIRSLRLVDDGGLWVGTSWSRHELPAGAFVRYDVLDAEGRLRGEMALVRPAVDRERDGVVVLDARHVLVIENLRSNLRALSRASGVQHYGDEAAGEESDADGTDAVLSVALYAIED